MTALRALARGRECQGDCLRLLESSERWRAVDGFVGLYEVSNFGRVRSVSRWVTCRKGRKLVEGRVLRPRIGTAGYPRVNLCNGEIKEFAHVHRLVAFAFVPGSGDVVRHLDGNPANASANNLAWGSFADNESDKLKHGRMPLGEKHHNAKLNESLVRQIRGMHSRGLSQLKIASSLGLNRGVVGVVVRREGWTHVQ